ncbi:MAG: glycosyltransferase family 39 protein [Chloroflexi bacterium]|nr:glycosyltransferase family 39 protein [Chloroflexota bacterium]
MRTIGALSNGAPGDGILPHYDRNARPVALPSAATTYDAAHSVRGDREGSVASAALSGLIELMHEYPAALLVGMFNLALVFLTRMAMQGWYRKAVDATTLTAVGTFMVVTIVAVRPVRVDASLLAGCAVVALAALTTGWFQHEALLGDYDSGNYAFRAAYLGRTGDFAPMFLPGYTVYVSVLHHFGGYGLQQWGNPLLLAATLVMIVQLGTVLTANRWTGVAAAAMFATHYTTVWFARQTLSDNMGLFLLTSALYFLVAGVARRNPALAAFSLVPASLMLLSRPEALLFLIAIAVVLIAWWSLMRPRTTSTAGNLVPLALISLLVAANAGAVVLHETRHGEEQYYRGYFEKAAHLVTNAVPWVPAIETAHTPVVEEANPEGLPTHQTYTLRFVGESFYKYGLHIIFGAGLLGLLFHRRNMGLVVVLLGAVSPVVLLIIEPTISWVHPWFMRHYWEALLPIGAVLAGRWVTSLGSAKYGVMAAAALVAANLWMSWPLLTLSDSRGMHDALAETNALIADRDALVLAEPQLKYAVDPLHFLFDVNQDPPVNFIDDASAEKVASLLGDARARDRTVYLISRHAPSAPFPGIELADGSRFERDDLRYVGGTVLDTRRLVFLTTADRYAKPESIPPKPLTQGYAPIAETVGQLPPRTVKKALYRFYVYQVMDRQGTP